MKFKQTICDVARACIKRQYFLIFLTFFFIKPVASNLVSEGNQKTSNIEIIAPSHKYFNHLSTKKILVLSDLHLNLHTTHTMELAPKKRTLDNELDKITYLNIINISKEYIDKGLIAKPDIILLLGDLQSHKRVKNDISAALTTIFQSLRETFTDIPIVYIFGNNDSPQHNYGNFFYNNISPFLIAKNNAKWQNGFISNGTYCTSIQVFPCIFSENQTHGYFTAKLDSKLKLIALNSVLFSKNSDNLNADLELNWFAKQLKTAYQNNEQIVVAMHIPVGDNIYNNQAFWQKRFEKKFIKIISKYPRNVIGIFNGHHHQEEVKILFTPDQQLGMYSVPSLSTSYGNAPGFKLFSLNNYNNKWKIANYNTYKIANEGNRYAIVQLYDFQSYYCDNPTTEVSNCLQNVNINKIQKHLNNGNYNQTAIIKAPTKFKIS